MRRRTVSVRPIAIDRMLASASSGQALPVFGSFFAAGAPPGAAAGAAAAPDVERDAAGACPAPEGGVALASVAFTCGWVMTFGGCVVTSVAESRSPAWKSE